MEAHLKSSHIAHARWEPMHEDPLLGYLAITFTNGDQYGYSGVPEVVYHGLRKAERAGDYFHREIMGRFEHERLVVGARNTTANREELGRLPLTAFAELPSRLDAIEVREKALRLAIEAGRADWRPAAIEMQAARFLRFLETGAFEEPEG